MDQFSYFQPLHKQYIEMGIGVVIFTMHFCAIFIIKGLYRASKEEEEARLDLLRYQHIEEENRIYSRHRHDFRNHLLVLAQLLEEKQYRRLEEYLISYRQDIDEGLLKIETGLKEIDVLLYSKINRAKEKNIKVNFKCTVTMSCHKNRIFDLISILSNLLDNALEACETIKNKDQRLINIIIQENILDYQFIIGNSIPVDMIIDIDKIFEEDFSTENKIGRGKGLYIVKQKVEKYEGNISIQVDNHYFQIDIEIPKYTMGEGQ